MAVIADLCNECGNCTTFCPSAGKPYLDKPRLFLDRNEFEAERDNAFMIFHDDRGWSMDARFGGETLQIDDSNTEESEPYATMRTLLRGIAGSVPDLPTADPGSAGK